MERNIQHVYPVNDTIEHILETEDEENSWHLPDQGGMNKCVISKCPCKPRITYFRNGAVIVTHDAMDGRLGVEWANEILNNEDNAPHDTDK